MTDPDRTPFMRKLPLGSTYRDAVEEMLAGFRASESGLLEMIDEWEARETVHASNRYGYFLAIAAYRQRARERMADLEALVAALEGRVAALEHPEETP